MKSILIISSFFFLSAFLFSCAFAPVNNQYEKAGTLKKGNLELAGNVTSYNAAAGGEFANTNNNFGFRAGYGISNNFDLKLRYERLMPTNEFDTGEWDSSSNSKGINYFSLVPKIALIPEKLSLLIPISHYSFTENIDGQESHSSLNSIAPQLIYTLTSAKNKADLSFGVKADCFFGGDGGSVFMGATVGAGFSSDLSKWAVRPEIGATFFGGDAFLCYGIGVQLIVPKRKR